MDGQEEMLMNLWHLSLLRLRFSVASGKPKILVTSSILNQMVALQII